MLHPFLLSLCLLLHATVSDASLWTPSPSSYKLEAGKDVTYLTNASENAERRQGIDTSLRKYAFMALSHVRTGIVYNATLPPYFDGIKANAIRLRYGSLKKRGLKFNEFTIPVGITVSGGPVVVLIYRKIFNFTVYSLPAEYDFAGPVVGIVAYATPNVTFDDIPYPEAAFTSPIRPITVHVPLYKPISERIPQCAFFGVDGSVTLRNVSSLPNVCTSGSLFDVSLVLPAPKACLYSPPASPSSTSGINRPSAKTRASNSWKIALGATFGAIAGLILLAVLAIFGQKGVERIRIAVMKQFTDHEEPLQTALIGQSRAPTAPGARTRPTLETDKFQAGSPQL